MTDRAIAVGEVLRYTKPRAVDRLTHPCRNYWVIQRDPTAPDAPNVLQEAGINSPEAVRAPEGWRMPVLSLRSTPAKSGTMVTPWHDEYRLTEGRILYFGDHKSTTSVALGGTTGNRRLVEAWERHRSTSPAGRLLAPPVLVFRTVSVRTGQGIRDKGFIEFCGLVVIENLVEVAIEDPTTGRVYPNYAAELAVLSLEPTGRFDWRWIDDRRKPWLTADETLSRAPDSWRRWISAGSVDGAGVRRIQTRSGR